MNHPYILVDLDMVLADFEAGFRHEWSKRYPERPLITAENSKDFYIEKNYDPSYKNDIDAIINSENFLINLLPIEGAISGFLALHDTFKNVRICTAPLSNQFSASEKWRWVSAHIGKTHACDMIMTKDKTLVKATHLIDDKPVIVGACTPEWKHIIYTQPYNREIPGTHFTWGMEFPLN